MCQEVLLNKELSFLRGSMLIVARSVFLFALYLVTSANGDDHWLESTARGIDLGLAYKVIHVAEQYHEILEVLYRFSTTWECSGPRDKIYSVLGLVKDSLGIIPDYEADVVDVFTDFALRQIKASQSLDVFTHIFQPRESLREADSPTTGHFWPTWVPPFEKGIRWSSALNHATGSTLPRAEIDLNQRVLNIKGWQIEQIDKACGTLNIVLVPPHNLLTSNNIHESLAMMLAAREALAAKGVDEPEVEICYGLMTEFVPEDVPSDFAADRALQSLMNLMQLGLDAIPTLRNGREEVVLDYDRDRDGSSARELLRRANLRDRTLSVTTTGRFVTAIIPVRPGDVVTAFPGGEDVYVLRAVESGEFIFMGRAFAHGYMEGELIHDPEWEEDLRRLIHSLLELSIQRFDDMYDGDISYESRVINANLTDLRYCIGSLTLTGSELCQAFKQEEWLEILQPKAEVFLHSTRREQLHLLGQAILVGLPIGDDLNAQWRLKWWNMIEKWIEAGLIRAPEWMTKLRMFTIR